MPLQISLKQLFVPDLVEHMAQGDEQTELYLFSVQDAWKLTEPRLQSYASEDSSILSGAFSTREGGAGDSRLSFSIASLSRPEVLVARQSQKSQQFHCHCLSLHLSASTLSS